MDPTDPFTGVHGVALIAIFVNLLAALVAVPLALRGLLAGRRGRIAREVLPVALLVGAAFVLRWGLPVHTTIHENHHGFNILWPLTSPVQNVSVFGIPWAFHVLVRLANALLPVSDETTFLVNVLLASAGVGGVAVFARVVFRSRLAGWAAGVTLLFLPIGIGMAATEESMVAGTGFFLCGAPLVWLGARDRAFVPLVAGLLLISLAAAQRDITLVLSASVPLLVLAAERGTPWQNRLTWALALGVPFALLAPRAWLTVSALQDCGRVPCGVMGFPRVQFLDWWLEGQAPFVPTWVTVASALGVVLLVVRAPFTRAWRAPLAVVGCLAVARVSAGLVTGGYFPSHLRHGFLATSLLALPVGWLVARLVEGVPRLAPHLARAVFVLVPIGGALSLAVNRDGAVFDFPIANEYRFLRDTLAGQEPRARFVSLDLPGSPLPPVTEPWVHTFQPAWEAVPLARWLAGDRGRGEAPTYLVLDRSCFTEAACPAEPRRCGTPTPSPFGALNQRCAQALASAPWQKVAELEIVASTYADLCRRLGQPLDLRSFDEPVRVAILRLE